MLRVFLFGLGGLDPRAVLEPGHQVMRDDAADLVKGLAGLPDWQRRMIISVYMIT